MATEKCSFFDSTDEDIREYAAEEFAEYFGSVIGNGIFNGGSNIADILVLGIGGRADGRNSGNRVGRNGNSRERRRR